MGSFSRLCTALAVLTLSAPAIPAALAQTPPILNQRTPNVAVDFEYFLQRLSPYGKWLRHPVWGDVWQPEAGPNFRPYFYGYWQYTTDYGWLWLSNEPYGDVVYHYGRWAYDPNYGWIWVPGYVWGPSWVAWRDTGDYIGWLPMPPGYQDFSPGNLAPSYNPGDWYGYQYFYGNNFALDAFAGLWLFVPNQDFGRRDRRPYVFDKDKVRALYRRSRDRTHYDRDHDRVVDRSIDKDELERNTHRSFGAQEGRQFLRRDAPITSVTEGQEIARRNRERIREGSLPQALGRGLVQPTPDGRAQAGAALPAPELSGAGPRRVGRGLFAVPPDNSASAEAGAQSSSQAPRPGRSGVGVQSPAATLGRTRTFLGRNLAPDSERLPPNGAEIAPPTDRFGETPNPPLSQGAGPAAAEPGEMTPSGVRVRRYGSPPPAVPPALSPPSTVTISRAPVIAPAPGLQRGFSIPVSPGPVVPRATAVVPTVPPSQPPSPSQSSVTVPQAVAPTPPTVRPLGRGLMGGFQIP